MNNLSFPSPYGLVHPPLTFIPAFRNQDYYPFNLLNTSQMQLLIQHERQNYLQLCEMGLRLQAQNSQQKPFNDKEIAVNRYQNMIPRPIDTPQNLPCLGSGLKEESIYDNYGFYQSESTSTKSFSPHHQQLHNDLSSEAFPPHQNTSFTAKTIQPDLCKQEDEEICRKPQLNQKSHLNQQTGHIKTQILNMVEYFTSRFGPDQPEETSRHRIFYGSNEQMLRIFDAIAKRYTSTGKCREDMSRFAMRKALTFLRDGERKASNSNVREASLAMCHKYFSLDPDANEQDILNELLPYKKNSKNKTPNCDFAAKIFASEAFCVDYKQYLSQFDQLMEADNKKKIKKFVEFLVGCAEHGSVDKIDTYKRMPWLSGWIESTKIVANELLAKNSINGPQQMMTQGEGDKKKKRGRVPR